MRVLHLLVANIEDDGNARTGTTDGNPSGSIPLTPAAKPEGKAVAVPTYQLPTGSWVIDKRGPRPDSPSAPASSDSPDPQTQNADQSKVSGAKLWWSAFAYVARWGTQADLTAVSNEQLLNLLKTSLPSRYVVFDRAPDNNIQLDSFIALAADEQNGDWRVAIYSWISRHWPLQELVEHIYHETTISSERLNPRRVGLLLRLLKSIIGILPREQACTMLEATVLLATQDINPYKPTGGQMLARRAVIDILRERPELYETAAQFLTTKAMHGRSLSAAKLICISMRNRADGATEKLIDLTSRVDGEIETLEVLAGAADGGLHRDICPRKETVRLTSFLTRPELRKFGSAAFVGALTVLVAMVANRFELETRPASVPIAAAVATLALLVTAHVFSMNFSGSRLPSEMARHASNSVALDVTYCASEMLVVASLLRPRDPAFSIARDWTAAALLTVWTLGIIITMLTVFGRTDSVHAADRYYKSSSWRLRATGRRQGRIQARALALEEVIKSSPYISIRVNLVPNEWSVPIYSSRRGIVSPSIRSMRSLLSNTEFQEGLQVRLTAGLGTLVEDKTLIAVLMPADDQKVTDHLASATERALMTKTSKTFDMQNAEAISLLKVVNDLASSGDVGSARSVARTLSNLTALSITSAASARRRCLRKETLRDHARTRHSSVHDSRSLTRIWWKRNVRIDDKRIVVSAPGLNDVVRMAAQYSIDLKSPMFSFSDTVLAPILRSSGEAESFSSLTAFAIPATQIKTDSQREAHLATLRSAGIRALELRSLVQFGFIFDSITKLIHADQNDKSSVELLSVLLCFACRYDQGIHATYFRKFCSLLGSGSVTGAKALSERHAVQYLRIGAAAISEGAMTCCVSVARELVKRDVNKIRTRLESDTSYIELESTRSNFDGGYLGDTPERCLTEFLAFVNAIGELTLQPDTAMQPSTGE